MKRLLWLAALPCVLVACGGAQEPASEPAAAAAPPLAAQPYATLAQLMRALPFPNSNTIFDTQDKDPEAGVQSADPSQGATATYGGLYGGWQGVENAALMLSETANLITIPGRLCENGLPVPLDREDFRKAAEGLAAAGQAAYKAAQTKNQDAMVEAAGVVADACAACHEVYRDKPAGQMRCIPTPPSP